MTRADLDRIQRVRMNDFTNYDPDKCNNGGCYGYWTEYTRMKDGKWCVTYGTTSDLEFCPVCGSFGNHWDDEKEEYECGDFCYVTDERLLILINGFIETEDEYIELF